VDALYARGWAKSLRSSYMDGAAKLQRAFHLALQAHSDEAKVLEIDPDYVDAKLVVGTYQYVIGALPWGFKLLFGFADHRVKSRGMETLRDDFTRGPMTSIEAGTVIALSCGANRSIARPSTWCELLSRSIRTTSLLP